ncbi:MAG TPA: SRPBCC family protein [Streptosporangiaceae bacterium]
MTAPLRLSLDVACSPEHAFGVWTERLGTWWPRDHTVTGQPEQVVLQAGVGGRIYERGADGTEHDWGEVTVWQPPERLAYLWHIGRDQAGATEVEIRFLARGPGATRVEIEHRGWERLGAEAADWRDRNQAGWQALIPHFLAAIAKGAS